MSPDVKTTFSVLGAKFRAYDHEYREEGGGMTAVENMAAIARVGLILLPPEYTSTQRDLDTFVRRVEDLLDAERNGARSTRYDRVQDTMDEARRQAVARFEWLVGIWPPAKLSEEG